jgi:hypothetical protein
VYFSEFLPKCPYREATLEQKHSLMKMVFKEKLIYVEGEFRAPVIDPIFLSNALIINEKWLIRNE